MKLRSQLRIEEENLNDKYLALDMYDQPPQIDYSIN